MNKVVLIGRLTKDPELRYTPGNGVAVCRFTLAINRLFKKDETDFINCIAFNKQGEAIAQYVTKGRQLAVIGNIRTGSYDGQDGIKRYTTDILVESFEFIGNSNNGNVNTNNQNNDYWNMSTDNGFGVEEPIDDGDMPF
ncbi:MULTISPECIES: single-stranded DNA-binding protein [Clostridium]|uniref:Single-stranded DNA-binding protein n=1 Tax=Clostridium disporicum TaxID=84024 RepID=A0A174F3N4_9CLOT|nr:MULTISPECIES: single-stranded DNA-binding protein [Clostridium]CUO43416.1 phage-related single-strand DNA-binding protein [Clostridium disporicum]